MSKTHKRTVGEMTQDEIDEMYDACMAQLDAEAQSEYDYEPEPWEPTREEEEAMCKRDRAAKLRRMAAELRSMADVLDGLADIDGGKPVPANVPGPMPYQPEPYVR